jgi:signal transduction histidine kinase
MNAQRSRAQQSRLAAHRRWLAAHRRFVIGGALALWAGAMVTFLVLVVAYDLDFFGPLGGPFVLGFGSFAITGAVIGWHRPGHVLALLFLVLGLAAPLANILIALALGPLAAEPLALRTLLVAPSVAATSMVFPLLPLAIVLFPDGRLPSPRWRWLPWLVGIASALGGTAAFAAGAWGGDVDQAALLGAPFGGNLLGAAATLSPLFFALLPALLVSSGVAAVLRFRRGDGVTRQQLKWLALAALVLVLIVVWLVVTLGAVATPPGTPAIVMSTGVAFVPISAAIAIVRHGLYDIDLVLSRTIVFVSLAAFITALYSVTVVGIGSLIGDPTNLALTIGTTALVALVFEPVRARVQHWANRAVYGRRATPYEVLTAIVDDLPIGASSDDQLQGLATLLADGTAASHATIWVEDGGTLHAAACSPVHDLSEHGRVAVDANGALQVPRSTHAEPVRLEGALLGALSFERGREDPVNPNERALLAEMAGQASLLLGNARLRERLRARVQELRSSRQRLVAAQDEARRRIERDLHDGAQQQLVALKVKLGLARTLSIREEAGEEVTHAVEGLSAAADVAVESLRTLARGIYPPLLEAEGLERALVTQAQRSPIEIEFRAEGLRRYHREVEATVYFCVLEAMRNVVTHAAATRLEVLLDDRDGRLRFQVVDDGRGFDPAEVVHGSGLKNMADRIDALAGSLAIEGGVDGGVRLTGSIPISDHARAERPDEDASPARHHSRHALTPANHHAADHLIRSSGSQSGLYGTRGGT